MRPGYRGPLLLDVVTLIVVAVFFAFLWVVL